MEAAQVIRDHRAWRERCLRELRTGLVYLADELFLRGGMSVPGGRYYEGLPQLENGIGLTRTLLDDWSRLKRRAHWAGMPAVRLTLACGTLIAPTLRRIADEWNCLCPGHCQVVPVANRLFGESVTVSGLLAGQDVVATLRQEDAGDLVLLPRAMFDASGRMTLDEASLADLEASVGKPTRLAATMSDIAETLLNGAS